MSAASWLQFVAFVAVIIVTARAAGPLHGQGVRRRREGARRSGLRSDRAGDLPRLPRRPRAASSAGPSTRTRCIGVQHLVVLRAVYALQRLQGRLPFNPTDVAAVVPAPVVQHRGQLHDEHELAVLRRRGDDEPPHPDGRACRPELRVGRGRHGDRRRAHPRRCRAGGLDDHRQLLGRPDPLDRSASCCRCRSSSRSCS